MGELRTKHHLSEILICGYEYSVFLECLGKEFVIIDTTRFVEDREDIELLFSQLPCQGMTCAFVYRKAHSGGLPHQGHE